MTQHVATEIQNETVVFVRMKSEPSADHLVIQSGRHGRTHQRHAVDVGRVEAGRQDIDVAQIFQIARLESVECLVTFGGWCRPTDETAIDLMLTLQHLDDMLSVLDARGEDQRGVAVGCLLDDLRAGSLHQLILVHQVFTSFGHKLTAADMQAGRVGLRLARLGDQRAEKAVADQFADAHFVTNVIQKSVRRADRSRSSAETVWP